MDSIEQLARDLLARLSHDYGDSEDCPPEVQALFDRGETLLPVMAPDDVTARTRNTPPNPVYSRDECPFTYCDSPEGCKAANKCWHA